MLNVSPRDLKSLTLNTVLMLPRLHIKLSGAFLLTLVYTIKAEMSPKSCMVENSIMKGETS